MSVRKSPIACVIAALASSSFVAPAFADTISTVSETVRIADLNLESAAGMDTLNRRIDRATQIVCSRSWDDNARRISSQEDKRRCIADVRRQVAEQLEAKADSATLSLFATELTRDIADQ